MVESLNYSYDHGELSSSQKRAIITLIEKKEKDRRNISNWRPTSLINVDVKIGSKAIAKRLEAVLPKIIHHNQCAYVKDRTISDAVRSIDDILDYTKKYQIPGRLIAVDFKKAFDSVMHQSIETPAPRPPGLGWDLTRPKPGFNALLTARWPRWAVDLTNCQ